MRLTEDDERELDGVSPEWRDEVEEVRPGLHGFVRVHGDLGRCLVEAEGDTPVHTVDGLADCLEPEIEAADEWHNATPTSSPANRATARRRGAAGAESRLPSGSRSTLPEAQES